MDQLYLSRLRPLLGQVMLGVTCSNLAIFSGVATAAENVPSPHVQQATQSFSIPSASLGDSLTAFARQAGLTLSVSPDLIKNKSASPLEGSFTIQEALDQLLNKTGLSYLLSGNVVTITTQKAEQAPAVLDTIVVENYLSTYATTASKTNLPIREIPQAISVVKEEQIGIQGAQSLDQAFGYTAGVISQTGGARKTTDEYFSIRGIDDYSNSTIYVNGSKFPRNGFSGTTEVYGLERIEILKGPASSLYGRAAPGGIINVITKKPSEEAEREIKITVGNNDRKELAADVGGAIDNSGQWLFRIVGLTRNSETDVDFIDDDRNFLAPSITWQPNEKTSFTLRYENQENKTAFSAGLPTAGTVTNHPSGRIPANRFVGEPGYDDWVSQHQALSYQLEHVFNESVTLRQNYLMYETDVDYRFLEQAGFVSATSDSVTRVASDRVDADEGFSIDTSLVLDHVFGHAKSQTLIGIDFTDNQFERDQRVSGDGDFFSTPPTAIEFDLFNPSYVGLNLVPFPFASSDSFQVNKLEQKGIYLQNHLKIGDNWSVSAGVRHDDVTVKSRFTARNETPVTTSNASQDTSATTFNTGVVYLADNGLSPYASYSESFQPNNGLNASGNPYEASTGDQFEIGLKYRPEGSDFQASVAVFDIVQEDVVVASTLGLQGGNQISIESQGVELETQMNLNNNLNVIAAYAYVDAEISETTSTFTRFQKGNKTAGQPENTVSLWMDYRLHSLPDLTIGGGVRYYDETTNFNNDVSVPSYTIADLGAQYYLDDWKLNVTVRNLTDKEYISGCTYACWYGDGRSVFASLAYNW